MITDCSIVGFVRSGNERQSHHLRSSVAGVLQCGRKCAGVDDTEQLAAETGCFSIGLHSWKLPMVSSPKMTHIAISGPYGDDRDQHAKVLDACDEVLVQTCIGADVHIDE